MTWLEKFDRLAAAHSESSVPGVSPQAEGDRPVDALEALLDRYRAEGYPGMEAEIPPDLLIH